MIRKLGLLLALIWTVTPLAWGFGDKALTVQDIMRFRGIEDPIIAENGAVVAYSAKPVRGDSVGVVQMVNGGKVFRIPNGTEPQLSNDGRWAAFKIAPNLAASLKAKKDKKAKKLRAGAVLLNLSTGEQQSWDRVKSFAFSPDNQWLAIHFHTPEEKKASEDKQAEGKKPELGIKEEVAKINKKKKDKELGTALILHPLGKGVPLELSFVTRFGFPESQGWLAYAESRPEGQGNGLFVRDLEKDAARTLTIDQTDGFLYPMMSWSHESGRLAFLKGRKAAKKEKKKASEKEKKPPVPHSLHLWSQSNQKTIAVKGDDGGWYLPARNRLRWTKDDARLFFGRKPQPNLPKKQDKPSDEALVFDVETITGDRQLDVWHPKDKRIKTRERDQYSNEQRRTYSSVYHVKPKKVVHLADEAAPDLVMGEQSTRLILRSDVNHRGPRIWRGYSADFYLVDLKNGERTEIIRDLYGYYGVRLSPSGRYAVYYSDGQFHVFDAEQKNKRVLTASLDVPIANEDHDYPSPAPGYGIAGWLGEEKAVLINDKYDIWVCPLDGSEAYSLTAGQGRQTETTYRVLQVDEDKTHYQDGETVWLTSLGQKTKASGYAKAELGRPGIDNLLQEPKRFSFIAKAKQSERLLFVREDYDEFPNLWVAENGFTNPRQLTRENPQLADFALGKAELVDWHSIDGVPHQGVLIKPGNYEPGKRYPVLVYYYRIYSFKLHQFNGRSLSHDPMALNHRPNLAFYASNGYAVFLPDVRFKVGTPGDSAVKSLVPGVQKLVDMGVADPDAIGLHGHSWSGYQTAHVITRTDIFAASVAGAPVSNMTSAYSGIRLGSGLARQFQYELGQSRIGGSLWEKRNEYIENSPVFFADRINTPLLIMFGDIDDAVPWQQGIELYLAMRRLEKDVIFLQYRDEPHHLKKFPNMLDYALKMKHYFDHHLKGAEPQPWITDGVPYTED